jgi:hypothetical protein
MRDRDLLYVTAADENYDDHRQITGFDKRRVFVHSTLSENFVSVSVKST